MMIPSVRVRWTAKKDALVFHLRNFLYLSIFNFLVSKNFGFSALAGPHLRLINAGEMLISSVSHGLQSNVLSFAVFPTPGANGAA